MYKKEDLKFLNMDRNIIIGKDSVFGIENKLSIEEKINFIDEVENGIATYLINFINKWDMEKESLSKDSMGRIRTVSKKAWIKKNDERKIIDKEFNIGSYYLFGTKYKYLSLICPTTEHGYRYMYTDDNIVNQWFHDLCVKLYRGEEEYFKSINPLDIKLDKLKKYVERYSIYFDSDEVNDIAWNNKRDIDEKELDIYLEAYQKIEKYVEYVSNDVKRQIELCNK